MRNVSIADFQKYCRHCSLLGVARDATAAEIKGAFRRRALKLHPDVNSASDANLRFQEISGAYGAPPPPSHSFAVRMCCQAGKAVGPLATVHVFCASAKAR